MAHELVDREAKMRLYIVEGMMFYPVVPEYLLYLCTKEEYDNATSEEVEALVAKALAIAGLPLLVTKSKQVH